MSKPWIHAKSSAKKYGGKPEDYLAIHDFMDSSKAAIADVRHRAALHSSFGCFIIERVFGTVMVNSSGKEFSPRDVAEDHCIEDLGFIPSLDKWLGNMAIQKWMGGPANKHERERRTKHISFIENCDPFDPLDEGTEIKKSTLTPGAIDLVMSGKNVGRSVFDKTRPVEYVQGYLHDQSITENPDDDIRWRNEDE